MEAGRRGQAELDRYADWGGALCSFLAVSIVALIYLDEFPLRLSLYVGGFASIAFAYFAYARADHDFDVFHPSFGLFLLVFLYSLSSALFIETEKTTFYGESLAPEVYPLYYLTCIAGVAGLACGLAARRFSGVERSPALPVTDAQNAKLRGTMLWCCLVLCGLFLPYIASKFNFLAVRSYYETALSSRVERMGVDSFGTMEVLTQYLPLVLLQAVCAWAIQDSALAAWKRMLALIALAAFAATAFLAGERGTILYCGLIVLAYRHFRIARVRLVFAVVAGAVAYFLMSIIPVLRSSSDPVQMWRTFVDTLATRGLSDLSLTYNGELATATNLARHIQGMITGEADFTYGRTLVNDFLVWIPRILYADRPLPSSELFIATFYPGVREQGGGYGFFILQEGYWAFGIPGAFVSMAGFGWIVDGIYRRMWRWQGYDVAVFLYAALYTDVVMSAVRSGIIGSFKAAILHAVPFGLVLLVHWMRTRWQPRVESPSP